MQPVSKSNPRTTAIGWLVLLGAIVTAGISFLDGNPATSVDPEAIFAALAGVGLISAKDGNK